jgi:hypothetical protein
MRGQNVRAWGMRAFRIAEVEILRRQLKEGKDRKISISLVEYLDALP